MRLIASIAMLLVVMVFSAGSKHVSAQTNNIKVNKDKKDSARVVIKPGDTLTKIAKEKQTTYQRIFYANGQIKDPDVIYPGDKVKIPTKDEKLKPRPLGASAVNTQRVSSSKYTYVKHKSSASKKSHYSASGGVWDSIAQCESGGNWRISTGNGYYGGLQFTASSWRAAGGKGLPSQASKSEQIARAKILQSRQGWGAWPACTAKLGIR